MNRELAQIVALVTYGNDFLRHPLREPPELFPSHSTFQYVSDVSFHGMTTKRSWFRNQKVVVATNSRAWYTHLRSAGVTRLQLGSVPGGSGVAARAAANFQRPGGGEVFLISDHDSIPHHMAIGFAGAGDWVVQADSANTSKLWRARWSVRKTDRSRPRIWSVEYDEIAEHPLPLNPPDLGAATNELRDALIAAETLAEDANLVFWADQFAAAIGLLDDPAPAIPYHPDLFPPGFQALHSRQLLASACTGWVFGGMGSWNDLGDISYSPVSSSLYQALRVAIAAAANSTAEHPSGSVQTAALDRAESPDHGPARVRDSAYWLRRVRTDRHEEAVQAIVDIGVSAVGELIRKCSADRSYKFIEEPLKKALRRVDSEALLMQLVDHPDGFVRAQVLVLLIETAASPGVVAILRQALGDPDSAIRVVAVQGLSKHVPLAEDAIRALVDVIKNDTSDSVCIEAMRALDRIGPAGAAAVRQARKDEDPRIRELYAEAFKPRHKSAGE